MSIRISTVYQFSSQCIQHIDDTLGIVDIYIIVASDEGNHRTFFGSLDNGVSCRIVGTAFSVSSVVIEDVGEAAVVFQVQRFLRLLMKGSGIGRTISTYEVRYCASCIYRNFNIFIFRCTPFTLCFSGAIYFIGPCSTILQPQVNITFASYYISCTIKRRFFCIQC